MPDGMGILLSRVSNACAWITAEDDFVSKEEVYIAHEQVFITEAHDFVIKEEDYIAEAQVNVPEA